MKKIISTSLLFIFLAALVFGIFYAWRAFPIISGYGAKNLCSCVFLGDRDADDVIKNELGFSPMSFASFSIDRKDSSATGTVFGFAKRKAFYRTGLGCTLLNNITEEEFRSKAFNIIAAPEVNQDSIPWPNGDLLPETKPGRINYIQLQTAINTAFNDTTDKKLRRTRAVIVLFDGQIIAEKYAEGFNGKKRHTGWSMAKGIGNALIGILVKHGKININAPPGLEQWKDDERKNIRIGHLLNANSGLQWEERYDKVSDATNMLYKVKNMSDYALKSKLEHPPGSVFEYSSGTSNILSYIMRRTLTDKEYYKFPYKELFHKIGMYSTVLEIDAAGNFVSSSYCFASPRDWARFGLLYLNDGVWQGERILPKGWVSYTATPAKGAALGQYGAQFWLNKGEPENVTNRKYRDVPADCFYADGFEGQNIWIIPSKKLVVVRLALQQGNKLNENVFLAEIIKALPVD
ncbi:MAG: serine hydrolase domain-containing protein [Chitinophagaceae bacterium]